MTFPWTVTTLMLPPSYQARREDETVLLINISEYTSRDVYIYSLPSYTLIYPLFEVSFIICRICHGECKVSIDPLSVEHAGILWCQPSDVYEHREPLTDEMIVEEGISETLLGSHFFSHNSRALLGYQLFPHSPYILLCHTTPFSSKS